MDSPQQEIVFETVKDDRERIAFMHSNRQFSAAFLSKMHDSDESLCDVKLYGQPAAGVEANSLRPIRCHKVILANVSQHLKDLFTVDGYIDSNQMEITIGHVEHESLRRIVEFTYTDKLSINADNAIESIRGVLIGAKYLGIKQLAAGCEVFLTDSEQLNVENCLSLWCFAHKYNCMRLMQATSKLFSEQLVDFKNDDEFWRLSYKDLAELLKSPAAAAANADQRCLAAIAWLNYDSVDRSSHVAGIVDLIPLSPAILFGTVSAAYNCKLLCENAPETIKKLVGSVLERLPPTSSSCCPDRVETQNKHWYLLGGHGLPTSFMQYDVHSRTWASLSNLPWPRNQFAACAVSNRLIAIGGVKDNTYSAGIDEYDLVNKMWLPNNKDCSDYAKVCGLAACVVAEPVVYVFGGGQEEHFHCEVKTYNAQSKEITEPADMRAKRFSFTANYDAASNSIFIAGGRNGSEYDCSVDKYDIITDEWSAAGTLKTARAGFGAALSGDDLYFAGGYAPKKGSMCSVEIFNVVTGQTRSAPDLLQARDGCQATRICDGNVVCVLGGRFFTKELRTVETYDVREGKWTTGVIVPNMPEGVSYFAFSAV